MKSKSQYHWQNYFESANCSIYEIIHHAIRLAALEDPREFSLRRGQIVEKLYSCQLSGCCCDDYQLELEVQNIITAIFKDCKNICAETKSNLVVNADNSVGKEHGHITSTTEISKYNVSEAEELIDAIDNKRKRKNILQVQEIKDILDNCEDEETELFVGLRKLQLMVLSVEVLEVTKIGTTVSDLQQHWSKQIRELAKTLADGWKAMIKERIDVTTRAQDMHEEQMNSCEPTEVSGSDKDVETRHDDVHVRMAGARKIRRPSWMSDYV